MTKSAFLPNSRPRTGVVELEWPVVVNGVEYHAVHLVRLTAGEVESAIKEMRAKPADATFRLPIFRDENGAALADEVLDALDDDDFSRLDEAARDFFPRRFLGGRDSDSAQPNSETIAHSSALGSAGG